jgi:hypothetical protein
MLTVQIPSYNYFITALLIILQYKIFCYNKIFYSFHYQWTEETDDTGMLNMGCDCLCHWLMKLKGLKCVDYHTHTLQVQSFWHCALTEVFSCNLYTYNMLVFAIIALIRQLLHTHARAHTHTNTHTKAVLTMNYLRDYLFKPQQGYTLSQLKPFMLLLSPSKYLYIRPKSILTTLCFILMTVRSFNTELLTVLFSKLQTQISGIPRNFVWGGFNKFSWGQREWGSGGGSPLVRGSGSSCNLVQEILFHIVKFF